MDIITGGSPCQDLSVAGNRAGLAGERSGLFMEQIRIVKEMRERDRRIGRTGWLIRPRFMVWENVPGAFSSNKGADFQAVLSEIVKIAEPDAPDVPMPEGGRWSKSGCLYSELGNWSVAWRVHDAQFWGVPQRRKRIALVADFGGLAAPEILFERKGLSGDLEPGEAEREGTAASAEGSSGAASGVVTKGNGEAFLTAEKHMSLTNGGGQAGQGYPCVLQEPILLESNQNHATIQTDGISTALPASMGMGGGYVPMIVENDNALSTLNNQSVCYALDQQGGKGSANFQVDVSPTILSDSHGTPHAVAYGISSYASNAIARSIGYQEEVSPTLRGGEGSNQKPCVLDAREPLCIEMTSTKNTVVEDGVSPTLTARMGTGGNQVNAVLNVGINGDIAGTLDANYYKGCGERQGVEREVVCIGNGQLNQMSMAEQANTLDTMHDQQAVFVPDSVVRRLTPLECERLQGYPDGWTDIGEWIDSKGKKHKEADSPRYKALGNSIALPFWAWMARRICAQYERPMTMGSLFDGIGGFPLVFERAGAKAVWASEIEEFCVAVTKTHFPKRGENL